MNMGKSLDEMVRPMVGSMSDERQATYAWSPDGEYGWTVGRNNVDEITVYAEYGEMSWVPYIRVLFEDGNEVRVAARFYEIHFEKEREE